ncbi:hypothetical protein C8R43DRAFT_961658 [Mycena crocata]|nr:hypothetical protein C8R43DRAFT_961658 [Mycena crocata]
MWATGSTLAGAPPLPLPDGSQPPPKDPNDDMQDFGTILFLETIDFKLLVQILSEIVDGYCIDPAGSTLCFYDSLSYFLKSTKPGEGGWKMRWDLPMSMGDKLRELKAIAEDPAEHAAQVAEDEAWLAVAQGRMIYPSHYSSFPFFVIYSVPYCPKKSDKYPKSPENFGTLTGACPEITTTFVVQHNPIWFGPDSNGRFCVTFRIRRRGATAIEPGVPTVLGA